jgi:hypothetical protein
LGPLVLKPSAQLHGPKPVHSKLSVKLAPRLPLLLLLALVPLTPPDVLVPDVPDDDDDDVDPEDEALDVELEVPGPSPFVVVLHATKTRRDPSASADFMERRLPC